MLVCSQVHFSQKSALVTCGVLWVLGLTLAMIPLTPATDHWNFFSQTGICIPLPFAASDSFPGYSYSFSVMIVVNFILFVFIAVGQGIIYYSVVANSIVASNKVDIQKTDLMI